MTESYLEMTHKGLKGRFEELMEAIGRNAEARQHLEAEHARMEREASVIEGMLRVIDHAQATEATVMRELTPEERSKMRSELTGRAPFRPDNLPLHYPEIEHEVVKNQPYEGGWQVH